MTDAYSVHEDNYEAMRKARSFNRAVERKARSFNRAVERRLAEEEIEEEDLELYRGKQMKFQCDSCEHEFDEPKVIIIESKIRFGETYTTTDTGCPKCNWPHFTIQEES